MSTRSLVGLVERLREKSFTDPNPDKRAAFEEVLDLLARIDTGTAADLVEATAPRPIAEFPRDWRVCDSDANPDSAFDADFPAEEVA